MLGVNQSDFMSYTAALKSNYRKGIRRMEAILANPTHAKEFAANLGGVRVVLGVPVNLPDRNSDKLLELLLGSDVADDAVETWLHQFYEFTGWDDLLSDSARCKEMANNPLIWRAAGGSKLAVGKSAARAGRRRQHGDVSRVGRLPVRAGKRGSRRQTGVQCGLH